MPAVGSHRRHDTHDLLLPAVPPRPVNHVISLDRYYRSADLVLRQAGEYRAAGNEFQLYVMLMRFAGLVIETIPQHKDFPRTSMGRKPALPARYREFQKVLAERYLPELEALKPRVLLGRLAAPPAAARHAPGAVRLTTSDLPEIRGDQWGLPGGVPAAPSAPPLPPGEAGFGPQPGVPGGGTDFGINGTAYGAPAVAASDWDLLEGGVPAARAPVAPVPPPAPPNGLPVNDLMRRLELSASNSLRLPVASEAARSRHALMPTAPPVRRSATMGTASYPRLDASPAPLINYGIQRASAPPAASLMDSYPGQQPNVPTGDALYALEHPRPQLEPALGPQEVEVLSVPAPQQPLEPGATCSHSDGALTLSNGSEAALPALGADAPGEAARAKQGIGEVHVSVALMEEFLQYAASNTRRNIESCGILGGKLNVENGVFSITTLIIPKQQGTSDTVEALAEEETFEVQDSRSLYPLGWIHTHPSQSCFLSSVDVHTHCGYQTQMEEAIAIVMAPRDAGKRCGLFRLSTPGGLQLVQKCAQRGFHAHPRTATGQPLYELCGHVFLNPQLKHDVVDLRSA